MLYREYGEKVAAVVDLCDCASPSVALPFTSFTVAARHAPAPVTPPSTTNHYIYITACFHSIFSLRRT